MNHEEFKSFLKKESLGTVYLNIDNPSNEVIAISLKDKGGVNFVFCSKFYDELEEREYYFFDNFNSLSKFLKKKGIYVKNTYEEYLQLKYDFRLEKKFGKLFRNFNNIQVDIVNEYPSISAVKDIFENNNDYDNLNDPITALIQNEDYETLDNLVLSLMLILERYLSNFFKVLEWQIYHSPIDDYIEPRLLCDGKTVYPYYGITKILYRNEDVFPDDTKFNFDSMVLEVVGIELYQRIQSSK